MRRSLVRASSRPGWIRLALILSILSLAAAQSSKNTSSVPAVTILLNCGARESNNDADGRLWEGDEESKFAPAAGANAVSAVASWLDPALPSAVPYKDARIFTAPATYSFAVSPGRYWLRLHFYPANYGQSYQRSDALFTVVSDPYTLLHNFSTSQTADALIQAYLVREFSINVSSDRLNVTFSPERKSGYAFINGIELVPMPDIFSSVPLVGTAGKFTISSSTVLQTMNRLNVGGQYIPPTEDSNLSRTWYDDSPYIYGAVYGVTNDNGSHNLDYGSLPQYIAPVKVYTTFRSMTRFPKVNVHFNLTWMFNIDANFTYLVRLHFCEWIYTMSNQRVFNIYLNNQTAQDTFDVIGTEAGLGNPIYRDYAITVQAEKGYSTLFVALQPDTTANPPPQYYDSLLNGLELFKLNDSAGSLAGPNPVANIQDDNQVLKSQEFA